MKYRLANKEIKEDYGKNLLRARGVDDVHRFLFPTEESCLQDFSDLENYKMGVKVIEGTIQDQRPYAIIADCDCDGVCSFAIIYQYLKRLNPEKEIVFLIHEGKQHGFSDLIDKLEEKDWSLIIAPDSATNDGSFIKNFNCPVLVLDHHLKEEDSLIPDNMILINNQTSEKYKNKNLCGGGVTWQFCRALDDYFLKDWAYDYIDLCAVSIVGDMMSMLEYENQYLVQTGFKNIKNKMLKTLFEKQDYSMGGKINPTTVAFYIVPLLNAMIRVGTMKEKYRLYRSFIEPEAMVECHKRGAKGTLEKLCIESARECTNAKSHQDKMKEKVVQQLEAKIFKQDLLENQILFVRLEDEDDFPSELNGLVAMVLSAKYHKPTILARRNQEGYDRGSIRAPSNTEMGSFKEYLTNTGLFEYVMGHDNAAGCSILDYNLSKLHEIANEDLSKIDFGENIYDVNFIRKATDNDIKDIIMEVAPYEQVFGQQNPEAMMAITNLIVSPEEIKIIGKNKDTLRIEKNGITYVKFKAKDMIEKLSSFSNDMEITLVGRPNINEWMGHKTPQLFIIDMEVQDGRFAF